MAKYEIVPTGTFRRDLKLAKKRGLNLNDLYAVVEKLANDEPLDVKYHNHPLSGDYQGFWDCHIKPDWLLIYRKTDDGILQILELARTGTHSDIFKS